MFENPDAEKLNICGSGVWTGAVSCSFDLLAVVWSIETWTLQVHKLSQFLG